MSKTDKENKAAQEHDTGDALSEIQRHILLTVYPEVCATWRTLMDVRFKLLALVPFVTVTALALLLSDAGLQGGLDSWSARLICVIGMAVTVGLFGYEVRNAQRYRELARRGRQIEDTLGTTMGVFGESPKLMFWLFNHSRTVYLIYFAAFGGWVFALFAV